MIKKILIISTILLALGSIPLQFPNLLSVVNNGPLLIIPYCTVALESLLDIAIVILIMFTAINLGMLIAHRWLNNRNLSTGEQFLAFFTIGFIALTLLTFVIALIGFLNQFFLILLLIISVYSIRQSLKLIQNLFIELRGYLHSERTYFGNLFFGVLVILLLANGGIHLISNLYPTTEPDAINYHLFPARVYTETQSWQSLPDNPNFWPESMEMLSSIAILIKDHVSARMLHGAFLPLIYLALLIFIMRFDIPPVGTLLINIFLTMPIVSWVAGDSTTNDLTISFFILWSLYLFWLWHHKRQQYHLVLSALALGAALGTKHSALFVLPFFFLAFLFYRDQSGKIQISKMLLFFGIAILVVSPWYVKSFMQTGNPIWPAFSNHLTGIYNEYGARLSEATKNSFGIWNFAEMYKIPYQMCFGDGARLDGTLGPFPMILILAVIVVWIRTSLNKFLLFFTAISLLVWLLLVQEVRYLIFLVPPFLLAAVPLVLDEIRNCTSRINRTFQFLLLSIFCVILLLSQPFFYHLQHDPQRYTPLVQRRFLERYMFTEEIKPFTISLTRNDDFYLSRKLPTYNAVQFINKTLPESVKVFFLGVEAPYLYTDRSLIWDQRSHSIKDQMSAHTPEDWLQILRRENVSHLLFRRADFRGKCFSDLESDWVYRNFQFLYAANDFYLFQLREQPNIDGKRNVRSVMMNHPDQIRANQSNDGFVLQNFLANFLGDVRNSLILAGKASVEWDIALSDSAFLQFGIAKLFPCHGDGGTVLAVVKHKQLQQVLFSQTLAPKDHKQDRVWRDYALDISAYAGERITIRFESGPGVNGDATGDWFALSEPMIVRGKVEFSH
ncbi:MAG: hypothetical protein V1799_21720 [bacterium]